jgi:hypothetical protein
VPSSPPRPPSIPLPTTPKNSKRKRESEQQKAVEEKLFGWFEEDDAESRTGPPVTPFAPLPKVSVSVSSTRDGRA